MAVVNSDILRIIAFNDYKHDSKPKHGVRGASAERCEVGKISCNCACSHVWIASCQRRIGNPPRPFYQYTLTSFWRTVHKRREHTLFIHDVFAYTS